MKLLSLLILSLVALAEDRCNGETIRNIDIQVLDVFDDTDLEWLYRTVNKYKTNTKHSVIKRELLFKEGDSCDHFRLEETERVLRAIRYIRKAKITAVPVGAGEVDIHVSVQDTWTLLPQISFSSGTGNETLEFGISESNILGYGKRGEFLYREEDNRESIEMVYQDPRIWNSDYQLLVALFDRNDGKRGEFGFGKPFRSLYDEYSWDLRASVGDTVGRLFKDGDERQIFGQELNSFQGRYTHSMGEAEKKVERYSLGYRYEDAEFRPPVLVDYENLDLDPGDVPYNPSLLPENRKFSGPIFSYESVVPEFISRNYIDRFDREQDFNMGTDFGISTHIAPEFMGSDRDAYIFSANLAKGRSFNKNSFLLGEIGGSTRHTESDFENSLIRAEVRYFNVIGLVQLYDLNLGRHTFATGLTLDYGSDLDKDREFLLGADSGLRGYEAKTFTGDKRIVYNAEQRVHIADDVFRLVSLGAAAFFDAGSSTYSGSRLLSDDLFADVGVGLRFAFPRSSGGRVLRVDFALPLRDYGDDKRFDLRVILAGGQVFNSNLRSTVLGDEAANVAVGFDR